jgi:hypothetical protein
MKGGKMADMDGFDVLRAALEIVAEEESKKFWDDYNRALEDENWFLAYQYSELVCWKFLENGNELLAIIKKQAEVLAQIPQWTEAIDMANGELAKATEAMTKMCMYLDKVGH